MILIIFLILNLQKIFIAMISSSFQ